MQPTELTFDPAFHEYRVAGERWPSVTDVLDPLLELDGIPRAVLRAAADFGRNVHSACHLFNVGQLDEAALDPHLVPYLAGWKQFLFDTKAVVFASERRVVHRRLKYAGTLDVIVNWKRARFLIDVKTSASVPRTWRPQTAAYREACTQEDLSVAPLRYCMHLRPDGSYRLHESRDSSDWSFFLSCLNVWRWRNASS